MLVWTFFFIRGNTNTCDWKSCVCLNNFLKIRGNPNVRFKVLRQKIGRCLIMQPSAPEVIDGLTHKYRLACNIQMNLFQCEWTFRRWFKLRRSMNTSPVSNTSSNHRTFSPKTTSVIVVPPQGSCLSVHVGRDTFIASMECEANFNCADCGIWRTALT